MGAALRSEAAIGGIGGGAERGQYLATEVGPRQLRWLEVDDVVVDGRPLRRELPAHRHEEGVEGVELLAFVLDHAAVEAAPKLDAELVLRRIPLGVQRVRVPSRRGLEAQSVVRSALRDHRVPLLAKKVLKLVLGHVELLGLHERGL